MSSVKYIFRVVTPAGEQVMHPLYSDDLDKDLEMEPQQVFFREKLSSKLEFVRADFDVINAADIEHEFIVNIDRKRRGFALEEDWWSGTFTKTDGEFDADNRSVQVQPEPFDRYKAVMEGMNKEFNVVDIINETSDIFIRLQPVIQVYVPGSLYVNNYIAGGVNWEQPVTEPTELAGDLQTLFHFGAANDIYFLSGTPESGGTLNPDVSGYWDRATNRSQNGLYERGATPTTDAYYIIPSNILLDNMLDFGSTWLTPAGNTVMFLGFLFYQGDPAKRHYFTLISGSAPEPATGTLTHIAGGQYTDDIPYTDRLTSAFLFSRETIFEVATGDIVYVQNTARSDQSPSTDTGAQYTIFTSLIDYTSETRFFRQEFYIRVLVAKPEVSGYTPIHIPDGDNFVSEGSRYKYVIPYTGLDTFFVSDANKDTSDNLGKIDSTAANFANQYFERVTFPPSTGIGDVLPVTPSDWSAVSYWFYLDIGLEQLINFTGVDDYTLRDAYTLWHLISAFLQEIDPNITHEPDVAHSDFFYSLSNPIRGFRKFPLFTPKSNIVIGTYDQPAQRAEMRFSDLTKFLEDFYKARWYIDDENRFRLEHDEYFARGESYTTPNVGADLTTITEPKTANRWSYRTSKWKYEKQEIPERITHKWMDDVSEPFQGFPIQVLSRYVQLGNLDERSLSLFTSDINLVHVAGDSISQDGFMFFDCILSEGGTYILPIPTVAAGLNLSYQVQNGYASMVYAHEQYWKYQLPARRVNLNLVEVAALSHINTKTQEIEFASDTEPDPMRLVKTLLGDGRVKKLNINFTSLRIQMTLAHVTE